MKNFDIDFLSRELKTRTGVLFTAEKEYLLTSRLLPIAQKNGIKDLPALIVELKKNAFSKLWQEVTDALMTNESLFMRDQAPFDNLKNIIFPKLLEARKTKNRIRIWSAACSSGQEAYSIAMLINEIKPQLGNMEFEIVGSDISESIVEKAKEGIYSQFEVQRGLPIMYLAKYFEKVEDKFQIKPEIRKQVTFKKQNLLEISPTMGTFDIIFCRYVLIYFDVETKQRVFDSLTQFIAPDGYLMLGGSETAIGITKRFKPHTEGKGLFVPGDEKQPEVALRKASSI